MTSGIFHTVPVSSIIIERDVRQRRELKDIDILADSIRRLGLIHPPVLTREHVLVSGERRLEAIKSLGWTSVPIQYTDEIEPWVLHAIELEENVKRLDVDWPDECRAVKEYHELRRQHEKDWTVEKTGDALGISPQSVSDKIKVATELVAGNKRVIEATKFSVARNAIRRSEERQAANEYVEFKQTLSHSSISPPRVEPHSILNVDFLEWIKTYDGPRFNLIHCDFPYGIEADKFNQGGAAAHGGYYDSEEYYWSLIETLGSNLHRIALDSCHLMFWFSMKHYTRTLDALRKMGFDCDGFPLTWLKTDNAGILPDPERGPRRITEFAFFGVRGDRKIVTAVSNAYAAPTDRSIHMSTKPEPMLRHFFRMLVDEHTHMLDPTCGSGSALRAAESLGAGRVLGLERDPEFFQLAEVELIKARRLRSAA